LAALQALNVVDSIPAGDDLRAIVVTGGLHKNSTLLSLILSG
jgi:hypothetical protein